MTSTVHTPTDRSSAIIALRKLLDEAADLFRRQPQVTFTISGHTRGQCWRAFVASADGEVVCIDAYLSNFCYGVDRRPTGFAMRQRTQVNAHQVAMTIAGALTTAFTKDYAANVVVREVT